MQFYVQNIYFNFEKYIVTSKLSFGNKCHLKSLLNLCLTAAYKLVNWVVCEVSKSPGETIRHCLIFTDDVSHSPMF